MSALYFALTKIALQPLPLLLILVGVSLATLCRRHPWRQRICAFAPFLALIAACTPVVVHPVVGLLEWPHPSLTAIPPDAVALVVLGGGIMRADGVRGRPELTDDSLYRCLHAAELYRRDGPRLVVVTGGVLVPGSGEPAVAPAMRDLLIQLGVRADDVIVESRATTTFENAVESRMLLAARGLEKRKIVVVTEAIHMTRALGCFRTVGMDAIAAPCRHRATGLKLELAAFVPSPSAIGALTAALHEWLGLAWYYIRGRTRSYRATESKQQNIRVSSTSDKRMNY